MSGRAVGIDLGTSNSVVSAVLDGEAVVIPDDEGNPIQPSVVSFTASGEPMVGRRAKGRMIVDPVNTVYSVKRLVGRTWFSPEIKVAAQKYGYSIEKGDDDTPRIVVRGTRYTPEDIQATILRHMKRIAENYLGEPVTRAVITVPANFNEAQRRATRNAARLAGLDVMRLLNEPTAAALAYGYEDRHRERIAIYDLGGGTFDITLLELRDNVFEVLSTAGDTFLGGDDFDHMIAGIVSRAFLHRFDHDLRTDAAAMQRLKSMAEDMKIELTRNESASGSVSQVVPGASKPVDFDITLTREQFNQACKRIVQQTFLVCDEALQLAGVQSSEIDRLVLVGGSTRVPIVREMVEHYFFRKPLTDINPDEVVAVGAAIYAYGLEQAESPAVAPPPIPAAARSGRKGPPPIPRHATARLTALDPKFGQTLHDDLPESVGSGELEFSLAESLTESNVHPDAGAVPSMPLLIDVTPDALGIETVGGIMDILIHRNAPIPTRVARTFATSRDEQDTVRIQIYEGTSRDVEENRFLGELVLEGLPIAPRGDVRVEVGFQITADGMLDVSARDSATGTLRRTRLTVAGAADVDLPEWDAEAGEYR